MLPSRVIYMNKEFETIGFIKLNNGSFLFLKNENDIIALDLKKINLNLDLKFEIKEATKVERVLIDYIVVAIKNNSYQNNEELKTIIAFVNKYINTNQELLNNMRQLDYKDDVVDKTMVNLLAYFDDAMKDSNLKLNSVLNFNFDGKDYVRDESGNIKLKDDKIDIPTPSLDNNQISSQEPLNVSESVEPTNEENNPNVDVWSQTFEEPEVETLEKAKVKTLTLNKTSKAAFVDTLLLSFIVGLVSGMYLVFLIILIMS